MEDGHTTHEQPGICGTDAATRRALLWIIAASALAHLWCLGSQFYLDDLVQIRDSEYVKDFRFMEVALNQWTFFWYSIQAKWFGMSPIGFHAVNWLLHTAVACVLFLSGRAYLGARGPAGAAWFGAMLFAVHPLASEIPNYARTQDLAWVTLFSLLAAWFLFQAMHGGGWRRLVWMAVCIAGATFSKGPGFMHALMMTGVIGLAFVKPEHWQLVRKHARVLAALAVVGLGALWAAGLLQRAANWAEPRVLGHAYTLCRVFWEFAWRSVLPIHLSADHHIQETLVPPGTVFGIADHVAQWAALGLAVVVVASLAFAWRRSTRMFGVCLILYVGTILMRFAYFVPEFMPEYRIYPGLPWFCLGAAVLLTGACRKRFLHSARIPALVLIVIFAAMSAKRSFLFHDLNDLMGDVLKQYPCQLRAVWVMQRNDLDAGRFQAVIDRHERQVPKMRESFIQELKRLAPARELPTGHFSFADVGCWSLYARALAAHRSPAAGLREINQVEAFMTAMKISPKTNLGHWIVFRHAKGLILEANGNLAEAAKFLAMDPPVTAQRLTDLTRVQAKLQAQ